MDFGDAKFTTPDAAQETIRSLLKRSWRHTPQTLEACLVLITGEPGGGKSTLTQEVHYSIAMGAIEGNHSLVPVIVLAEGLTAEVLQGDNLAQCLVRYLNSSGRPSDAHIASFIESNWSHYDFLVIIDGLDEISQRSMYADLQRRLKELLDEELRVAQSVSRRFLLSCRTDDDIGIFTVDRQITLRGLTTARERRRFSDNLIATSGLQGDARRGLSQILNRGTSSLVGLDVYRRNPYFLVLLLEHIKNRNGAPIDASLDFDFLMQDYIAREADRIEVGSGSKSRRKKLRESYIDIASIVLQFTAFFMSTATASVSLYGRVNLDATLVRQFMTSVSSAKRSASETGPWFTIASLVEAVGSNQALEYLEAGEHVGGGDLYELGAIASTFRRGSMTPEQSIRQTFKSIAPVSGYDPQEWDRFAMAVLFATSRFFDDAYTRAAAWIFARGLAGAYALRLVYLEERDGKFSIRFRHRRIAEYFSAKYFEQRWTEVAPTHYSPWLSNVLNLVCALEKEGAPAFKWLVNRVRIASGDRHIWRAEMFAAAEASAFTSDEEPRPSLASRLADRLISSLIVLDLDIQHDLISRIATVKSLEVLASTGVVASDRNFRELVYLESQQSPQSVVYTGRAVRAAETIVGKRRSFRSRLASLRKSLVHPAALVFSPGAATAAGMQLEALCCLVALICAEAGLWIGSYILATYVATLAVGLFPLLPSPEHLGVAVCLTLVVHRIYGWLTKPMSMDYLARFLASISYGVVKWALAAPLCLIWLPFWALRAAWRSVHVAIDLSAKLPTLLLGLAAAAANSLLAVIRDLPRTMWVVFSSLVQVAAAASFLVALGWMVVYLASSSTNKSAGDVGEAPSAVPEALREAEAPASANRQVTETVSVSPPAKELPNELCEATVIGVGPNNVGALRGNPSPEEIDARREKLTGFLDKWEAEWVLRCPDQVELIQDARVTILTGYLDADPLLMVKPKQPPTFDGDGFSNLAATIQAAASDLPMLEGGPGLLRAMELEDHLQSQITLLAAARKLGTVSALSDGRYEAADQFPALAATAATMLGKARLALAEVRRKKDLLRDEMLSLALSLILATPLIYALVQALRVYHLRRSENAEMKLMDRMTIGQLAEKLGSQRTTDRARKHALARVQDSTNLTNEDLLLLEQVATRLAASSQYRDRLFVTNLLERLASLSHRIVRHAT